MEDLFENFSRHVNKIISSKLASKIRNLSRTTTNYRTEEDFSRLETNIQTLIESYLSNLKENDYKEISNNIFNSFVEEDDKNLIKAINFYKRTYEHYQEMNLRKKFNKWRKTALKLKIINNLVVKENNLKIKMEDLLENFSKHINKLISSKLSNKIRNLTRATSNYRTEEDYYRVESNIQMLIESYLSNLKDNDYKEIANNIFNSFVEEDDKNLIKAINFFKRTYEHYQEMNLRKRFFKWRKTSLKLKMMNNLLSKDKKAQNDVNINLNNNNQIKNNNNVKINNKIIEQRYNDIEGNENIDNINGNNYYVNGNNEDNSVQEEYYDQNNYFENKNMENVEDFIEKENNIQNYKFNYGNSCNNNEDYKEEFSEELDVNKLYSKNQ